MECVSNMDEYMERNIPEVILESLDEVLENNEVITKDTLQEVWSDRRGNHEEIEKEDFPADDGADAAREKEVPLSHEHQEQNVCEKISIVCEKCQVSIESKNVQDHNHKYHISVTCDMCPMILPSKHELRKHKQNIHSRERSGKKSGPGKDVK